MTLKEFTKKYGVKFCTNHNGKMAGMISLSTSALCNPYCKKRAKCAGTICRRCYATTALKRFKDLEKINRRNFEILTAQILPEWPTLNAQALKKEEKPKNLIIIQSSPVLNESAEPAGAFIDKIFTVYDDGRRTICKGKNCLECGKCYTRKGAKNITETIHK